VRLPARLIAVVAFLVFVAPLVVYAQLAGKVPRIGVLAPGRPAQDSGPEAFQAFRQGLRDLGYIEGRSIAVEVLWDEGRPERLPALAAEFVGLRVDVILAGTTPGALAAQRATHTIPIVMAAISDPEGAGLVTTLARPGGNITGRSLLAMELSSKRMELLKEAIPALTRVAVAYNAGNPTSSVMLRDTQAAAKTLGVHLQLLKIQNPSDLEGMFATASKSGAQAVLALQDSIFNTNRVRLADLALKHRLPMASGETGFAAVGGLMNYGPDIIESWRRSAVYVDKILKGAKPADLPVEQPTKFELVINQKTAHALGLIIPASVLLRADRVID
jgi:putative ABC transport system substrate-binding protein